MGPDNIYTPLKAGQARNTFRQTGDAQQHEGMMTSLADPSDVASLMAFLASDDANYVRGTIFTRLPCTRYRYRITWSIGPIRIAIRVYASGQEYAAHRLLSNACSRCS